MKSYRLPAFGAPLEPFESPTPTPRGTEVLLEVKACGACHTDLHFIQGFYDLGAGEKLRFEDRGVVPPLVFGHEPLGVVAAAGPDAQGAAVGATRLVYPWIGCGDCPRCRAGRDPDCPSMRTLGLYRPGGYATHLLVPHPRYLIDAGHLPWDFAATLACAGLTAYAALRKVGPLDPGDGVAVIGAGGVGLAAVGMAEAVLGRPVIAVDREDRKLAEAARMGAASTVLWKESGSGGRDSREGGAAKALEGVGAVLDFVGSSETARLGISSLRKGGRYVAVGLFGGDHRVALPHLPIRNISLIGSLTGTLQELKETVDLFRGDRAKRIPVETRPMSRINEALADLREGRIVGRVVLTASG